ncbi:MAG: hypothetical protein KAW45_03145 [Thermoplasmatales archaeon]|nr:hypothetical protein [Thermoplasmatales archaeon]
MFKKMILTSLCFFILMMSPAILAITTHYNTDNQERFDTNCSSQNNGGYYATLSAHEEWDIDQSTLETSINNHIPTNNCHSSLLIFTQCFSNEWHDTFDGRPKTTVITASPRGRFAYFGGLGEDAAEDLRPEAGRDIVDYYFDIIDGAHANESPEIYVPEGEGFSFEPTSEDGEIQSRHILFYAGKPEHRGGRRPYDTWRLNKIKENFAGQYQTTVTAVGGRGTADGYDYPGSYDGLEDALEEISQNMNENEQFIFFASDHGDWHRNWVDNIQPGDNEYGPIGFDEDVLACMMYDADNQAVFTVETLGPYEILLSGITVNDESYTDFTSYEMDFNDNGIVDPEDRFQYVFPIDENIITVDNNMIEVFSSDSDVKEASMSLGSGAIAQPGPPDVPEIKGPDSGKPGEDYPYEISSYDWEGDDMYFFVDWGDGTDTGWVGPFTGSGSDPLFISHSWSLKGTYTIKAKAKDALDSESQWGEMDISMPRNRAINRPIINFLEKHLNLFQILRQLLEL